MATPQDSRTKRRLRLRRAKKNFAWEQRRAEENAQAQQPKAAAKTAT